MLPLRNVLQCVESHKQSRVYNKDNNFQYSGILQWNHQDNNPLGRRSTIISSSKNSSRIDSGLQSMASLNLSSISVNIVDKTSPVVIDIPSTAEGNIVSIYKDPTKIHSSTSLITNRKGVELTDGYTMNYIQSHLEFLELIGSCQQAIDRNIFPTRISQGSSGSYYIKDGNGKIVAVFKPKDEEPYGNLNPKWIKWLHRTCCPCMFGRSFLMPNTGYISEAAASLVDSFLDLKMVPRTQVAHLTSSAFVYPWWEHYRVWRERQDDPAIQYPLKMGSFQLFVNGFEASTDVLARLNDLRPLQPHLKKAFQMEFEKMTILDYAIRNTDRTMDNWLIHLSWVHFENRKSISGNNDAFFSAPVLKTPVLVQLPDSGSENDLSQSNNYHSRMQARLKIACIDNGLAFPLKHPDEWRSYPYSWASLAEANTPYSQETRESILNILSSVGQWELLVTRLRQIFMIDTDFDDRIFRKQMSVMRGQLYNICQAMRLGESPAQLVARAPLLIDEGELSGLGEGDLENFEKVHLARKHKQVGRPVFSCC